MKQFFKIYNKFGTLIILFLLIVAFTIINPVFFSGKNLINILKQVSIMGIMAMGMTFVLLTGGIELSIGAQVSLVCVTVSMFVKNMGMPVIPSMLLAIVFTTLIDFFNGFLISKTKVPALILTLGTCTFLEGFVYTICGGLPVYGLPASLKWLGQYNLFGFLPVLIVIMLIMVLIAIFILEKTYTGRYFYAIGSNEEATKLSGIKTDKFGIIAYTLCGAFVGIAGVLMLGRIGSGQPGAGKGYEMDVLTGCVLGGVSTTGGKGKVHNAFLGILIIGVLSNGMAIAGLGEFPQKMVKGIVLILAILLDRMQFMKVRKKVQVTKA